MTKKSVLKSRLPAFVLAALLITSTVCWFVVRNQSNQFPAETHSPLASETAHGERDAPPSLQQLIDSAERIDFPELMNSILLVTNVGDRTRLTSRLMRRWLVEDLSSFADFLDEVELNGLELWDKLVPGMVDALRDADGEIDDPGYLAQIVERVLLRAAETDPKSALVWAREFLSDEKLDSTLAGIAPELAALDPEAAIALLDEVRAFTNQTQAAAGIGLALGRSGYPLAMTWAESFFSETERAFALSGVLHGMAGSDVNRAAGEYTRVVETMKNRYREQVLADRAAFGSTIDEEYEGLSREEIEKAELARPNSNLVYLQNATRAIALELARENPSQALEWARSMDIYQGGAVAMETIYEEWSSVDPEAAYGSLMKEPDRRPEVVGKLFGAWAKGDAESAAASALALQPGFERDFAIEGVARGWIDAGGRPARIAAWAERLQASSEVDRVSVIVASEAAYDNPVLALKQVQRISNPLKRSELFQEVFPNLVEENPNLARNALATIKLSPVEIEYFQSMLGP